MPSHPQRQCKICRKRHYRKFSCCSPECEATAEQIDEAHYHDRMGRRSELITQADIEAMTETIRAHAPTFQMSGITFPMWVKRVLLNRREAMERRREKAGAA